MKNGLDCLKQDYPRFNWDEVDLNFAGAFCEVEIHDKQTGRLIPVRIIHGNNRYY